MATILIVDDNEMLRTYSARALRLDLPGTRVITAGSCEEARRIAAEDPPQVVILDQRLEDGLGTDLLEDLSRELPGLRAIMATGETAPSFRGRALSSGAIEALAKPYEIEQLVAAVKRALPGPGLEPKKHDQESSQRRSDLSEPRADSGTGLRHRVLNRLSALLAGLRACEAELLDGAASEAEVRRTVERYFPRLQKAIEEASAFLREMGSQRDDTP